MARVLISVWIAAFGLSISSPGARAEVLFDAAVNRDTLTVGDPVLLSVRILREPGDAVALMQDEGFLAPFEVRRRVPSEVRETPDGRVEETLAFELAVYRPGAVEVPSLVLQVRTAEGDSGLITTGPIPVVVRSVRPSGMTDIRDVKPPVDVDASIPAWFWIALAVMIGLVAALLWYWNRRRRKPGVDPPRPAGCLARRGRKDSSDGARRKRGAEAVLQPAFRGAAALPRGSGPGGCHGVYHARTGAGPQTCSGPRSGGIGARAAVVGGGPGEVCKAQASR